MSDILLKDVPDDLHAQLAQEASANFRTPDQEVLARLQRSASLPPRRMAALPDFRHSPAASAVTLGRDS